MPGSRFEYSNFGFDVAALVIERVSGLPIEAFLEQRFFSRFEMDGTFARPARFADWPGIRTMGYQWENGGWKVVDVYDMEAFIGASNVYFPVVDLARWAGANAAGTAITPSAYAAGQQRSLVGGRPSPITGLSWYCNDSGMHCYYTGSINAFHGLAYWDRETNEAIAFVANSAIPPWKTITLQRDLVAALAGRPVTQDTPVEFIPLDADARASLTGTWVADGRPPLTITGGEGALRLREGDGLDFDAFQVGRSVFYVPGPDYWIAFSGTDGPSTLHARSMFVDFVAQRGQ
jgi:CubicO group peptidase (beta-lactamase class C family)